jgi:MtN3 and saliva related transmembrane protein
MPIGAELVANVIGFAAAAIGAVTFLPQVFRSWRSKQTADISLSSYLFLTLGAVLWLTYGILIVAAPIILVNLLILCSGILMLLLKKRYG